VVFELGCAARGVPRVAGPVVPHVVGDYRGHVVETGGSSRPCRVLLFAAAPDRIHAELLGPLGGPRWIVDGGAGRMAVTAVDAGLAYVGAATPEIVARVLGLPLSTEQLVAGLLERGIAGEGWSLVRESGDTGTLPDRLELSWPGGVVRLELTARRVVEVGATIGSGEPSPGLPRRSLEELAAQDAPRLFAPDDAP
jgi:hypothetical protein